MGVVVTLFPAEMADGMGEAQSWARHRAGGMHHRATNASTVVVDGEQDNCLLSLMLTGPCDMTRMFAR